MHVRLPFLLLGTALLLACADTATVFPDGGAGLDGARDGADGASADSEIIADLPTLGDGVVIGTTVVYAHSADTLYKVSPDTLELSTVGPFVWPGVVDKMTDIALDKKGKMIGISKTAVYEVDPETAKCTQLATLTQHFVGLSFVDIPGESEVLMGIAKDGGAVFRIDPMTGKSTAVGNLGSGYSASGDIVSVRNFGTVATVIDGSNVTDLLVHVDPTNGKATLIGDTGFAKVWGLGFWKNKLYGFTQASEFILIDVGTGKGTLVSEGGGPWWGAGVTTSAPVIN